VDTLYFIDKTQRHMWKSLALASIAKVLERQCGEVDFSLAASPRGAGPDEQGQI